MRGVSQKGGHGDFLLLWRKRSCLSVCFVVVFWGGGGGGEVVVQVEDCENLI